MKICSTEEQYLKRFIICWSTEKEEKFILFTTEMSSHYWETGGIQAFFSQEVGHLDMINQVIGVLDGWETVMSSIVRWRIACQALTQI